MIPIFHEIYNEIPHERKKVLKNLENWIEGRIQSPPKVDSLYDGLADQGSRPPAGIA
jgi:hypothetical protein